MRKMLKSGQTIFPGQTGRGENHAETGDSSSTGSRIHNRKWNNLPCKIGFSLCKKLPFLFKDIIGTINSDDMAVPLKQNRGKAPYFKKAYEFHNMEYFKINILQQNQKHQLFTHIIP